MRKAARIQKAPALTESPEIDGANSWTQLWRIHLPIAKSAVITFVLLSFMWTSSASSSAAC
ncbi:hypothetical protein [Streptomyces sp. NBC_01361]|uniref:hypothetical protein n=1 Tax=Streptomyces sp. NBC_01361 TaxID=2903838 RepID=UPI002E366C59|nr:hypothetical protein [Streptomyces sp. NBC_01361]